MRLALCVCVILVVVSVFILGSPRGLYALPGSREAF